MRSSTHERRRFRKVDDIKPNRLAKYAPYLAGLLDGEGTFTIRVMGKDHLQFLPMIEISMSHEDTIKFVADIFGVSYAHHKTESPSKDMHYLRVTTQTEVKQIAKALGPHSITKQEQIQLIIEFFRLRDTFPGGRYDSRCREILLKMTDICIELLKRNERGDPLKRDKPRNYEAIKEQWRARVMNGRVLRAQ